MRKSDFCIGENKGAHQLRSNCEADQRLCFCNTKNIVILFLFESKIKLPAIFCSCTGQFVSDLVGNPEDQFPHVAAQVTS